MYTGTNEDKEENEREKFKFLMGDSDEQ